VERGYSHYLMDLRLGLVDLCFEDIVFKKSSHKNCGLYFQQYIELGLYYQQVKRYLDTFGEEQVKIYFQEDLRHKSDEVIRDLYAFLDIDTSYASDMSREHNTFSMPKNKLIHSLYAYGPMRKLVNSLLPGSLKAGLRGLAFEQGKKPELSSDARQAMRNIYFHDIESLELLIDRDLSAWK